MFNFNYKDTRIASTRRSNDVVLVSLLLTLNRFHKLLECFHCWLWIGKCRIYYMLVKCYHFVINHYILRYKVLLASVTNIEVTVISVPELFNFEAIKWDSYWRGALKRWRSLFQIMKNYLHEILNLCNFLFQNK